MMEPFPLNECTRLRWNVIEGIGYLILDHPPSNTLNRDFFLEMGRMIGRIGNGKELKGIILAGSGRHFSSGADLEELLGDLSLGNTGFLEENYRVLASLEEMSVPVVAAIRGVCVGSAFELALICHFRICCEDAVLGLPESGFNLMPGLGGVRRIASLCGPASALELTLRGNTFGAGEAARPALVDQVVTKGELIPAAEKLIRSIDGTYYRDKRSLYINRYIDKHVVILQRAL